jgi:hypothetical protein
MRLWDPLTERYQEIPWYAWRYFLLLAWLYGESYMRIVLGYFKFMWIVLFTWNKAAQKQKIDELYKWVNFREDR